MRKRGVPSPDEAHAVALCFSEPGGVGYVRNANFSRDLKEIMPILPIGGSMSEEIKTIHVHMKGPSRSKPGGVSVIGHYRWFRRHVQTGRRAD